MADKVGTARRTDYGPGGGGRKTVWPGTRCPADQPATMPVGLGRDVGRGTRPVGCGREILWLRGRRLAVDISGDHHLVVGPGVEPCEQQLLLPVDHLSGPERLGGPSQCRHRHRPGPGQAVLFREKVVAPHHQRRFIRGRDGAHLGRVGFLGGGGAVCLLSHWLGDGWRDSRYGSCRRIGGRL